MAHYDPTVAHLTDQLEDTSIGDTSTGSRVDVQLTDALSKGMANWKIVAVGKLFADGELLPKPAERATKFAWTHLRSSDGRWRFFLMGIEPNIHAIKFENEDDQNSILYGTAWNFYNNLVVLREWTPSSDYNDLDFSSQKFWMEFKHLLPEFLIEEMIRLFAETVGEVLHIEVPKGGTKFRALVEISLTTSHLTGIHVASGAGVPHWIGFFYEGQPRNICSDCLVISHDSSLCSTRRNNRLAAEGELRNFGQALHFASEWRQPRDEIQVLRDTIVGLGVQVHLSGSVIEQA